MWWESVQKERWPDDEDSLNFIMPNWLDSIGDVGQAPVFFGMNMDEPELRPRLNVVLLKDKSMAMGQN